MYALQLGLISGVNDCCYTEIWRIMYIAHSIANPRYLFIKIAHKMLGHRPQKYINVILAQAN